MQMADLNMGLRDAFARAVGLVLQRDVAPTYKKEAEVVAHSSSAGAASVRAAADMSSIKAFIVEDSPIILDNLVATLEEMAPVQVVGTASDESTAMNRLTRMREDVDLVIIDVFLKQGSGLGVLRGATKVGLPAKCVVLTNYATADMREKCKALGAHRVFDKSTDLDDLISYCTRLADGYSDTAPGPLN
jgi:DNA-binding NtrC family response regulator